MSIVPDPAEYVPVAAPAIVVHALRENKRPIGFSPWPEEPKKKRKKKRAKSV